MALEDGLDGPLAGTPADEHAAGPGFRAGLYDRYVSAFKGETSAAGEPSFVWWDHKFLPLLRGLDRAAPVLDIGCGAGGLLTYLERRGFSHASGIDISAEQIALAQQRGASAAVGDAFDLLTHGRTAWAAIFAVDVFEHFSRDELVRLAPLLYAALRPGGRLLIQTANGAGLFPGQVIYGDLTHMTILTPQSLGQLLQPAGFVDLAFFETGPIPIRLRGRLDVAMWKVVKAAASGIRHLETGKRQAIWTENLICRAFRP